MVILGTCEVLSGSFSDFLIGSTKTWEMGFGLGLMVETGIGLLVTGSDGISQ